MEDNTMTTNTSTIKRTIKRLIRKPVLATISLLENPKFQRRALNILVGFVMLAASNSLLETVSATENCGALLFSFPVGAIMIFKNLI
jgi:hypothetical protein